MLSQFQLKKGGEIEMAIQKITDLTAAAQKGLTDFFEDEDGGTGKNAALSTGLLVGGTLMMHALSAQVAEALLKNCGYTQDCPTIDSCYATNQGQWAGCGKPDRHTKLCREDGGFCPDP